jgi:hypothetical protein
VTNICASQVEFTAAVRNGAGWRDAARRHALGLRESVIVSDQLMFVGSQAVRKRVLRLKTSGGRRLTAIKVQHAGGGSREGIMFPADHAHPEFGYFCLSQSLRRKARLAFTFITFCVIVGALALRAGHETGSESLLTLAPSEESRPRSETISTVGQSTAILAVSRAQERTACQENIHFDGNCAIDKVRRWVRPANDAPLIAAVALGRSAPASLPDGPPPPPKSTDAADGATIAPGVTSGQTTAAIEGHAAEGTTGHRAAMPRKMRKVSANQTRRTYSDRGRDDIWSARAYAFPNDGYSRYRYSRSWSGSSW